MGNVQASPITNQLLPFESYISDVPELKYLHGIGSTRFMKVARVDDDNNPMLVKIFVLADQSHWQVVDAYQRKILLIRKKLQYFPNCCPFTKVYITNRCAILSRPYKKFTLYDRLSTRPFLLAIEKRWIAFQLFKALAQCRSASICHGDIKSQNVLVSSSLWVQLTDFAPFKPTFLPSDDPSDFTFFFDTNGKRYCYLAPERFERSDELNHSSRLPGDYTNISEGLTESMDIFSMGCVLVELFTDGRHIPFTLSQVIDYKKMDDHSARQHIRGILNEVPDDTCETLLIMLDRNQNRRKEEFHKLNPFTSNTFPILFEKYLYRYMKELQSLNSPDDMITKLYVERDNYFAYLSNDKCESVVIFIGLVTATLRGCRSLTSKMDSMSLLYSLSKFASPSVILDRVVPYLINFLSDLIPQVRSEAIFVLTEILATIEQIPPDECRLLIDYIFPKMKTVVSDNSLLVKVSLASNIGKLAFVSKRFYEQQATLIYNGALHNVEDSDDQLMKQNKSLVEAESQALMDSVIELFVNLCGSVNDVRKILFSSPNLDYLCEFFGPKRATDILMHMITLLNDKPDWRIRATFFYSCLVVAKYLGRTRCAKLKPFLQQGLQDHEEFVVLKTLKCIHFLCDQQLISKPIILDLIVDVIPYLVHPNKWLRLAVVNILTVLDSIFSVVDIYCLLTPIMKYYFRENLLKLNDREVVYEALIEPISRQIWDYVLGLNFAPDLVLALENRRTLDKLGGGRNSLFSSSNFINSSAPSYVTYISPPTDISEVGSNGSDFHLRIDSTLKRLKNIGLNENVEEKLLAFKNIILKMDLFRKTLDHHVKCADDANKIQIEKFQKVMKKVYDLETGILRNISIKPELPSTTVVTLHPVRPSTILLEETLQHKQQQYCKQKRITSNIGGANEDIIARIADATLDIDDEKTGAVLSNNKPQIFTSSQLHSLKRRPNIKLLSHMHEHSEKITKLFNDSKKTGF